MLMCSTAYADPMDPTEQHQLQHNDNNQFPKWLCPNIFKYYVLLHDNTEGEEEKADAVYQSMKATFGMHACHLLRINSKSQEAADASSVSNGDANLPNPWVQYIKTNLEKEMTISTSEIGSTTNLASFPDRVKEEAELSNGGQSGEDSSSLDDVPNDPSPEDVVMVEVESPNSEVISHPLAQNFNSSINSREKSHSSMEELDRDSDGSLGGQQDDEGEVKSKRIPGLCFTLSDHDRMRIFVHEFVVRGLLPYMEKMIRNLSELQQNRKGLHRSFVSATKKWFGGRQDKIPVAPVAPDVPKYLREAPELQMRRLADLAFLVQMYELAYTSYHTAKRDFSNDQAWMHLRALEMAAISAFMHGNLQKAYPQHYMEHASHYYADVCKKINFASRNVMLYAEILKAKKMYNEAAMDFIKMTGEDSDLRSALFLEQASLCFIALPKPKVRKYAFHMILAGHRFSKASQRRHALRCYCQALQVYKGKGWRLAEGSHQLHHRAASASTLRQLENATSALRHLLTQESHQPAAQQGSFLREYLFVFKQLTSRRKRGTENRHSYHSFPCQSSTSLQFRVLLTKQNRPQFSEKTAATSVTFDCILNRTEMKEWQRLEEIALLYKNFHKKIPAGFKPFVHLFHSETDNSVQPLAVMTEPITVEILMENPLKIPLVLSQIHLLWRFIPVDFEVTNRENPEQKPVAITNEMSEERDSDLNAIIETEYLEEVSLLGKEDKIIYLKLIPMQTGELHITGLGYGLSSQPNLNSGTNLDSGINDGKRPPTFSSSVVTIPGMQELDIQGPRLNSTTIERCSVMYGPDRRLDPIIVPHMPNLEVLFQDFPSTLLSGEVCLVTVEFINEGHCSLNNLLVASDHPSSSRSLQPPSWEGEGIPIQHLQPALGSPHL
ncbi:putative trafficking protein particle complex subunit 8 [Apostichopus japonicus]|uniref:Putative trafficking protein particle complex subunit 8 n=1 Tax=Stichopus japonicus TaxID=307972 RepID=A0A2G8KIA5_STIJA|nr:putative trafficking protein particle complex subunit 8 [Apostichopus japonicus]